MTNDLFISGVDVYSEYGVTLLKGAYSELLKPPKPKPPLVVEYDNDDGEEVLFPTDPQPLEARDISLQIVIVANNAADFFDKKERFETLLRGKTFTLYLPTLQAAYSCYFVECTQYSQLEPLTTRRVSASLTLKLREPNPNNRVSNTFFLGEDGEFLMGEDNKQLILEVI